MLEMNVRKLTSLSFMANIIALACSAAFPTIGSKITLINASGKFHAIDVPCKTTKPIRMFINHSITIPKWKSFS